MTNQDCIVLSSLTKRYRNAEEESLKQVGFSIRQGEKFGILGPNGAGKTTLISILSGIITQTSGQFSFFWNGKKLSSSEVKHSIGFVPQEYAFYEELTPMQNMMYFGSLYNMGKSEIRQRTEEIFSVLGLSAIIHKKAKIFSGGMKRRMNLAIGIIHQPDILFLDEPTVGADVQSKHAMMEYLNKMNLEGTTIVYSSHHMSEAQEFCNRIAFINQGRLVACNDVETLMKQHSASDLKSLFIHLTGEVNFENNQ